MLVIVRDSAPSTERSSSRSSRSSRTPTTRFTVSTRIACATSRNSSPTCSWRIPSPGPCSPTSGSTRRTRPARAASSSRYSSWSSRSFWDCRSSTPSSRRRICRRRSVASSRGTIRRTRASPSTSSRPSVLVVLRMWFYVVFLFFSVWFCTKRGRFRVGAIEMPIIIWGCDLNTFWMFRNSHSHNV